jgi:molecular chaperone IbpA
LLATSGAVAGVPANTLLNKENVKMQTFDFTPFYRSTVGFDRLFSRLDDLVGQEAKSYPPYNIERTGEDAYRISIAVAGFAADEIAIESKENSLLVRGGKAPEGEQNQREFLHRGIAERAFELRFQLAEYVEVTGASLENGLLHVDLKRELPESKKPRQIAINGGGGKTIEDKTAH